MISRFLEGTMNNSLLVTKNLKFGFLGLILVLVLVLSSSVIFAQTRSVNQNYIVGFEDEQVVLKPNAQQRLPIVVSGATDKNAVTIRLEATGGIRILDISSAPALLSLGKQVESSFARLDVAKQSNFGQQEYIATVTITNTGGKGEIRFLDSTSVNGESPRTLGVSVSSEVLAIASPTQPVNVVDSLSPGQFNPRANTSALAVALAITITLLIFCILGIVALTRGKQPFQ